MRRSDIDKFNPKIRQAIHYQLKEQDTLRVLKESGKTTSRKAPLPPPDKYRSDLERQYAARLELLRKAGEILYWAYEPFALPLASDCKYTPDFLVIMADGSVQIHECKGWWRDDAKVKFKVARDRYSCWRWFVVTKDGHGFKLVGAE